jgi:hypothetical protein
MHRAWNVPQAKKLSKEEGSQAGTKAPNSQIIHHSLMIVQTSVLVRPPLPPRLILNIEKPMLQKRERASKTKT